MKKLPILLVCCFTLIIQYGCSKEDFEVIDNYDIVGEIQLDSFLNLTEIENGFILSGVNDSRVTILKLDVNFKTIWRKDSYEWGNLFSEGGWGGAFYSVHVIDVFQSKNGNLVFFCSVMEGGDVGWYSILIVELDESGNERNRIELDDHALVNVVKTRDNGYLLFGSSLIKLDSDLSTTWENDDQNYLLSGAHSTPIHENGFALTGTWNSEQVYLQVIDEEGIVQWTKRDFNKYPFNDLGYDLHQMSDDGFLIIGRTRNRNEPWDMNGYAIRADRSGDTIWTKKFGGELNEWLEKLIYAEDNDFIIKEAVGYPNDLIQKTILLRINGNGEIIESIETSEFEELLMTAAGYFVKIEKSGINTISLSKVLIHDIFDQ